MSATYNEALPTDRDKARSRIGDTDVEPSTNALVSDEHIDAVLAYKGSLDAAVAYLALELVAKFARNPVRMSDNGTSVDLTENLKAWQQIAGVAQAAAGGGALSFVPATFTGEDDSDEFVRILDFWP